MKERTVDVTSDAAEPEISMKFKLFLQSYRRTAAEKVQRLVGHLTVNREMFVHRKVRTIRTVTVAELKTVRNFLNWTVIRSIGGHFSLRSFV